MTMPCSSMDQRAPLGRILAGWIAILLCSLLLRCRGGSRLLRLDLL